MQNFTFSLTNGRSKGSNVDGGYSGESFFFNETLQAATDPVLALQEPAPCQVREMPSASIVTVHARTSHRPVCLYTPYRSVYNQWCTVFAAIRDIPMPSDWRCPTTLCTVMPILVLSVFTLYLPLLLRALGRELRRNKPRRSALIRLGSVVCWATARASREVLLLAADFKQSSAPVHNLLFGLGTQSLMITMTASNVMWARTLVQVGQAGDPAFRTLMRLCIAVNVAPVATLPVLFVLHTSGIIMPNSLAVAITAATLVGYATAQVGLFLLLSRAVLSIMKANASRVDCSKDSSQFAAVAKRVRINAVAMVMVDSGGLMFLGILLATGFAANAVFLSCSLTAAIVPLVEVGIAHPMVTHLVFPRRRVSPAPSVR